MFSHVDSLFSPQQKQAHFSSENQQGVKQIIQMTGEWAILFIHPTQNLYNVTNLFMAQFQIGFYANLNGENINRPNETKFCCVWGDWM